MSANAGATPRQVKIAIMKGNPRRRPIFVTLGTSSICVLSGDRVMVKTKRKSARKSASQLARKSRSRAKSKAKPKSVTVAALKRAVEGRDAEALAAMYADNAVMLVIDHDNPPSNPRRLAGKAAISSYFSDVCARDVAHLIENAIAAGGRLAFTQSCT